MNVVAINGSPSGAKGRTWWLLERFIKGMSKAGADISTVNLIQKNIEQCKGQLVCWFKTPGKCIIRDDVEELLELFDEADRIVLATPIYMDGMTALLKNFLDRMAPMAEPSFELRDGHTRHVIRGRNSDRSRKLALVSPCGYYEIDAFDPLIAHVKAVCKCLNAEYVGAVLRPAAPAIDITKFNHPLKTYRVSKAVVRAGEEFVRDGKISDSTSKAVSANLVTVQEYMSLANALCSKVSENKK